MYIGSNQKDWIVMLWHSKRSSMNHSFHGNDEIILISLMFVDSVTYRLHVDAETAPAFS